MFSELKILICDDSLLQRRQLKKALVDCGCEIILEADNGAAAVETYRKEKPDLVLLDIVMPQVDGLEALEQILAADAKANVVMLSSTGTKDNVKRAVKAGAKDFVQKPFEQGQLETILKRIFG